MKHIAVILFFLLGAVISFAQTKLPDTDIYLVPITKTRAGMQFGKPTLVSAGKGYNNQPYFTYDDYMYFVGTAGKTTTDIYKYNLAKRKTTRVTNTKDQNEYSPRLAPGEENISCVHVGRDTAVQSFYTYDLKGKRPTNIAPNLTTLGYYTWQTANDIYAFLVPSPFTLVHYRLNPERSETLANNIGRCVVNFRNKIFYVDKADSTSYKIRVIAKENMRMSSKQINKTSGVQKFVENKRLVENPILVETLEGEEDYCIMSDGTFLMGKEGSLYSYNLRKNKGQTKNSWTEIPAFKELGIGKFYRISISPDNTMLAVVVYKGEKP
jgi:hypothetical protein